MPARATAGGTSSAVTRWREDRTLDDWGSYIYLRDTQANRVWSAAYQPTRSEPDAYAANFSEDRVEFVRRDRTITTTTEVLVSAESDAEVRRVSLANMGGMRRDIEVTSYAEIVLGSGAADLAHPAFSKLFVQTEYVPQFDAILAHRRKRAPNDPDLWAAHFAVVDGVTVGQTQFETDRARFIGVGRDLSAPEALERPALQHGRNRARSDLQHPSHRAAPAREDDADRVLDPGRIEPGRGVWNGSSTTTTRSPSNAPGRLPGPMRRSSSATWT